MNESELLELYLAGKSIDYYKIGYDKIIEQAKKRKKKPEFYVEQHHIIPKCLNGNDDQSNLVFLTPLEHIVAHILLYRINPNNIKLAYAADCMLHLVSESTKEREEEIKKLDITILAELREKCAIGRSKQVVCFEPIIDSITKELVEIEVVKIYDKLENAKEDGFTVTAGTIRKGGTSGGYNWRYYTDLEDEWPEALQEYIKNTKDSIHRELRKPENIKKISYWGEQIVCLLNGEIQRIYNNAKAAELEGFSSSGISTALHKNEKYKNYEWKLIKDVEKEKIINFKNLQELPELKFPSTKIICHDNNFNILKIYNSLTEMEKEDGFRKPYICRILTTDKKFADGYYWEKYDNWKYPEKLKDYENFVAVNGIPKIKKNTKNVDKIKVVQCENNDKETIIKVYNSLHEVSYGANAISKVLQREDRVYKNSRWYRVSEYIQKYPDSAKDLEESMKIIDHESLTEMKFLLTISTSKLVSVNDLYKTRIGYTAGGRPYPIVYKNPKAAKIGEEIRNQLLAVKELKNFIPWLNRTKKYSISLNFVLKSGISHRDCQNLDKEICDDITRFIKNDLGVSHFDDSEFYECNFFKSILPGAKKEYVYVVLKESFFNDRIDIINKPEKIFLDGSYFPTYDWRSDLKELIDKEEGLLKYYDPTEDMWDSELRSIEKFRRCNTTLYTILPEDLGENLTYNIIDRIESISYGSGEDREFVYIAPLGELEQFKDKELERLEYLDNMIKKINRKNIRFRYCSTIQEILEWLKEG